MNQVQKISFQFSGEEKYFFTRLYADWDVRWAPLLEKSVGRILRKYQENSLQIELNMLLLDLGSIPVSDFERKFLRVFEEHLENELLKQLYRPNGPTDIIRKSAITNSAAENLFYFLLHGIFLWHTSLPDKNLNSLFVEVAKNNSAELRRFLRTYGHYTALQKRLVFQLDDQALKAGVQVLRPGESHFVISYVEFLHAKYKHIQAPEVPPTPYRTLVWQVVYAWLLTNRSSFFNRKSFLQQTLQQLSGHYMLPYPELLRLLVEDTGMVGRYPSELLLLLRTLHDEAGVQMKSTSFHWEVLRKLWVLSGENPTKINDKKMLKERLAILLSGYTNYRYLKLLQEAEILNIVKALIPAHYPFIKTYAGALERYREKGMLEGKSGSEFRIVKWQVMFPLLLENSGAGFNRLHFVRGVLQRVAAHYNISVLELLKFVLDGDTISYTDPVLYVIFQELYLKLDTKGADLVQDSVPLTVEWIVQQLPLTHWLGSEQQNQWKTYLLRPGISRQLLEKITEESYHQLIRILYAQESEFIIQYSGAIDQQVQAGALRGIVSGNFRIIRRQFILLVLQEFKDQGFNKKYFVENVLRKLAAHYNLRTAELVRLFYLDVKRHDTGLPFELLKILEGLYVESLPVHLEQTNVSDGEVARRELQARELLIRYLGHQERYAQMIKSLSHQADFVFFVESILKNYLDLQEFVQRKWGLDIDNRQLLVMLLRFSKDSGGLSKAEILTRLISWLFTQLETQQQRFTLAGYLGEKSVGKAWKGVPFFQDGFSEFLSNPRDMQQSDTEGPIADPDLQQDLQQVSFIGNAGLILLAPFLPRLFSVLQLTKNGKFRNHDAQIKAMFCMQYAVYGHTEFPEYELQLNKFLAGFKTGLPVPRSMVLTEDEVKTIEAMLQGVVGHWGKVKSVDGLREGFLQRKGKLEENGETIELTVESKAFDMLLDVVPWNFKTTRFSWMEKAIQVKWR